MLPEHFVTVTHGMKGYFAVHIGLTTDEIGTYHEPYESAYFGYPTAWEALLEAMQWAEDCEMPLVIDGETYPYQDMARYFDNIRAL